MKIEKELQKVDTSEPKGQRKSSGAGQQRLVKRKLFSDFVVDVQQLFANDT